MRGTHDARGDRWRARVRMASRATNSKLTRVWHNSVKGFQADARQWALFDESDSDSDSDIEPEMELDWAGPVQKYNPLPSWCKSAPTIVQYEEPRWNYIHQIRIRAPNGDGRTYAKGEAWATQLLHRQEMCVSVVVLQPIKLRAGQLSASKKQQCADVAPSGGIPQDTEACQALAEIT